MIVQILKYAGFALSFGLIFLIMTNCTMLGLNYASLDTSNKSAPTPQIAPGSLADWEARRPGIKSVFEDEIYGPWPGDLPVEVLSRRVADAEYAGGRGQLEELHIQIGEGEGAARFYVGLAVPDDVPAGGLGLVIGQTFSSNCSVFQSTALTLPDGSACTSTSPPWLVRYIFGEYIAKVPLEAYFDAGFAYASFYASDLVPDSASRAAGVMSAMANNPDTAPTGTLMAWGYGFSAAVDGLSSDEWLDTDRIAVFGHSRHAKSALLAGVWDRRIGAVIAHQSGFGGAALSRSTTGEGIARITKTYPHWFAPQFADYSERLDELPVDQHQLLALVAPTPVFLGNGRRDVWSDPNSTFRAAQAATPVYQRYGKQGMQAAGLPDYRPEDEIAYWLRPGGHGTDQRDIDAIMAFLSAHLRGG